MHEVVGKKRSGWKGLEKSQALGFPEASPSSCYSAVLSFWSKAEMWCADTL